MNPDTRTRSEGPQSIGGHGSGYDAPPNTPRDVVIPAVVVDSVDAADKQDPVRPQSVLPDCLGEGPSSLEAEGGELHGDRSADVTRDDLRPFQPTSIADQTQDIQDGAAVDVKPNINGTPSVRILSAEVAGGTSHETGGVNQGNPPRDHGAKNFKASETQFSGVRTLENMGYRVNDEFTGSVVRASVTPLSSAKDHNIHLSWTNDSKTHSPEDAKPWNWIKDVDVPWSWTGNPDGNAQMTDIEILEESWLDFDYLQAYVIQLDSLPRNEIRNHLFSDRQVIQDRLNEAENRTISLLEPNFLVSHVRCPVAPASEDDAPKTRGPTITVHILEALESSEVSTWNVELDKIRNYRHRETGLILLRRFLFDKCNATVHVPDPGVLINKKSRALDKHRDEDFYILETDLMTLTEREVYCFFRSLNLWGFRCTFGLPFDVIVLEERMVRLLIVAKRLNITDVLKPVAKKIPRILRRIRSSFAKVTQVSSTQESRILSSRTEDLKTPLSRREDEKTSNWIDDVDVPWTWTGNPDRKLQLTESEILEESWLDHDDLEAFIKQHDSLYSDRMTIEGRTKEKRPIQHFEPNILVPHVRCPEVNAPKTRGPKITVHILEALENSVFSTWTVELDEVQNYRHRKAGLVLLRKFLFGKCNATIHVPDPSIRINRKKSRDMDKNKDEDYYILETDLMALTELEAYCFFRSLNLWGFRCMFGLPFDVIMLEERKIRLLIVAKKLKITEILKLLGKKKKPGIFRRICSNIAKGLGRKSKQGKL